MDNAEENLKGTEIIQHCHGAWAISVGVQPDLVYRHFSVFLRLQSGGINYSHTIKYMS